MDAAISFREIIETWGSVHALARDIGAEVEVVRGWHNRDSIPAGWLHSIVVAAMHRHYVGVNYQSICIAAHNRRVKGMEPGVPGIRN